MRIRCIFVAHPPKYGMGEGFTPVAEWGWARTNRDFSEEMRNIKKELSEVEKQFNDEIKFEGWDLIRDEDEALEKSFELQSSNIDAVLLYIFSPIMFPYAFLTYNKPLIIFVKEYSKPFYGFNLDLYIDWTLKKINRSRWATVVWDSREWLIEKIRALNAVSKLKHTKILCIGRPASWLGMNSYGFVRTAQEKLGVTVEFISSKEFIKEFEGMEITSEIKNMYNSFLSNAKEKHVEIEEKSAFGAVKVYFLLKKMIRRNSANALTINCYETDLIDEIGTTPCFALSKLNDEGTVAACEGDFNALVNMLIVNYTANKPVFMGDPIYNPRVNRIINAHCACPTKLRGYGERAEPYIATTHYESGKGLTPQVIMKEGQEVTVTSMCPDLSSIIVTKGKIKRSNMRYPICRTQVEIEISNPEELWSQSRQLGGFTHMINVYGDCVRELEDVCRLLDINFVEIKQSI